MTTRDRRKTGSSLVNTNLRGRPKTERFKDTVPTLSLVSINERIPVTVTNKPEKLQSGFQRFYLSTSTNYYK